MGMYLIDPNFKTNVSEDTVFVPSWYTLNKDSVYGTVDNSSLLEPDTFYRIKINQFYRHDALRSLNDVWEKMIENTSYYSTFRYRQRYFIYLNCVYDMELDRMVAILVDVKTNRGYTERVIAIDKNIASTLLKRVPETQTFMYCEDLDGFLYHYQKPFPQFQTPEDERMYVAGMLAYSLPSLLEIESLPIFR